MENGITGGTGDGKFSPNATCTREQAVAFLYRASGSPAVSGGSAFNDVAANAYYADAVAWAEKNEIPGGIGGSRMIRSAAISVKDSGYCNMSKMLGGKNVWRMVHHVLPNILPLVLMNLANSLGGTIMMEATLNFLGFGVNINTPSWGYILTSQGRSKMYTAPWIGLAPGLAITIMVFAAAMFGDGVRDILDPRLKGGMGSFSLKKIRRIADKYVASRKNSEVA